MWRSFCTPSTPCFPTSPSMALSSRRPSQMPDKILKEAKILIVDDERANVRFLEIVLQQAGYHNVFSTTDPRRTLSLCSELQLDLLLLDLHMPHLDGFAVMEILQAEPDFGRIPILVLTAD